jgi:hypothetical protein
VHLSSAVAADSQQLGLVCRCLGLCMVRICPMYKCDARNLTSSRCSDYTLLDALESTKCTLAMRNDSSMLCPCTSPALTRTQLRQLRPKAPPPKPFARAIASTLRITRLCDLVSLLSFHRLSRTTRRELDRQPSTTTRSNPNDEQQPHRKFTIDPKLPKPCVPRTSCGRVKPRSAPSLQSSVFSYENGVYAHAPRQGCH